MECKFVVGQKVVCVDGRLPVNFGNGVGYGYEIFPVEGKIYTVREIVFNEWVGKFCIRLVEITNEILEYRDGIHELAFLPIRFRPLQEIRNEKFKKIVADTPDWLIRDEKDNMNADKKELERV